MDVKNVFIQGELEERVYMVQPPGFQSEMNTSTICQLKKFLYGLKQDPCAWNVKITQRLRQMGFATCRIRVYNGRIHIVPLDILSLGYLWK